MVVFFGLVIRLSIRVWWVDVVCSVVVRFGISIWGIMLVNYDLGFRIIRLVVMMVLIVCWVVGGLVGSSCIWCIFLGVVVIVIWLWIRWNMCGLVFRLEILVLI